MTEVIEYWNLVTGDRATQREYKPNYFNLEIVAQVYASLPAGHRYGNYRYGTSQGENLCAYATEPTFREAWVSALTHTVIGGSAYVALQEMQAQARDIDPGTQPDSPVYDPADEAEALTQLWAESRDEEGPFDPYAGNLDTLLDY